MKALIIISYVICLVLAISIYLFHLRILNSKKKSIGIIQAHWSANFNLSFPMSWLRWGAIFIYLLWCIYQIVTEPEANRGHFSIMLLLIFFSFAPRWNLYLGTTGILIKMKVILWTKVLEKKIVVIGKHRYLEMKGSLLTSPSEIYTKKIRLPKHISLF